MADEAGGGTTRRYGLSLQRGPSYEWSGFCAGSGFLAARSMLRKQHSPEMYGNFADGVEG
jgi:hypothetical protein